MGTISSLKRTQFACDVWNNLDKFNSNDGIKGLFIHKFFFPGKWHQLKQSKFETHNKYAKPVLLTNIIGTADGNQRRVALRSFVSRTTYRWSYFTLSINKVAWNCWIWIKSATSDRSLPHKILYYTTNCCRNCRFYQGSAISTFCCYWQCKVQSSIYCLTNEWPQCYTPQEDAYGNSVTVIIFISPMAALDKQSCVITSTLFEMNSTCMRWCDLNCSCLSTSITSAEVSSCQNKRRYPNPIWPTVFTFRVLKLSFSEFTTMVSLHLHKSTLKC